MLTNGLSQLVKSHRRDAVIIASDILSCATKTAKKTDLLYKAGLSSAQLDKYLGLLFRSELLECVSDKGKILYRTTVRGKEFLEAFYRLADLLNSDTCHEPEVRESNQAKLARIDLL